MAGRGLLRERTRDFALDIIRFIATLPQSTTSRILGHQLLRCGTSIGANYRAACRARSNAEFVAKMGIVEEEADETLYWLDLIETSGLERSDQIRHLMRECDELLAMTVSSIKRAKSNQARTKNKSR